MDNNFIENTREIRYLKRKWYVSFYVIMFAAALALNFLIVVYELQVIEGIDKESDYPSFLWQFLWIMLPMLNSLYFNAFEYLGKRLGFNLLVPLITTFSICVVSLAVPYLIVAI